MTASSGSTGGSARPTASERRAQYAREFVADRQAAEARADALIRTARANHTARAAFGDVARLVAEGLEIEQCDLLILGSGDRALLIQVRIPPPVAKAKKGRRPESARSEPTMQLRELRVPPTASPTGLLGEGPGNRVYVFLHHTESLRPLGVLSMGTRVDRRVTVEDRLFANALADRLAVAIAHGDFPAFR